MRVNHTSRFLFLTFSVLGLASCAFLGEAPASSSNEATQVTGSMVAAAFDNIAATTVATEGEVPATLTRNLQVLFEETTGEDGGDEDTTGGDSAEETGDTEGSEEGAEGETEAVVECDGTTCNCLSTNTSVVTSSGFDPDFALGSAYKSYGFPFSALVLEGTDFCTDASGAANSGEGLFAYFTVTNNVIMACDNDTAPVLMSGSEGIWRQDSATDACPEIYGNFLLSADGGGTSITVYCHITVSCETLVPKTICRDENGFTIEQDGETQCTMDVE